MQRDRFCHVPPARPLARLGVNLGANKRGRFAECTPAPATVEVTGVLSRLLLDVFTR